MLFMAHNAQATTVDNFNSVSTVNTQTDTPGSWYIDRKAPAGFSSDPSFGNPANGLALTLSATDYQGAGSFYNTQGRKYDVPTGTLQGQVQLYLDAAWLNSLGRDAGFWATGIDGSNNIDSFAIMEIANGHVMGWDSQGAGGWLDFGAATAGQWATLGYSIDLADNLIDYWYDGNFVGDVSAGGTTVFSNVMLQSINTGVDRTYYFDNLVTNTVAPPSPTPVPEPKYLFPSALALLIGVVAYRNKKKGLPLFGNVA
jgi:hypothetical protein